MLAREARCVFESPGRFDGGEDRLELGHAATLNRLANDRALLLVSMAQRVNQRQCGLALREIIAEVLAPLLRVRAVVEYVIHQLIGGAEMAAVGGELLAHPRRGSGKH